MVKRIMVHKVKGVSVSIIKDAVIESLNRWLKVI
jgi:hypothetical protein